MIHAIPSWKHECILELIIKAKDRPSSSWSIASASSSDDVQPEWCEPVLLEEPTSLNEDDVASIFNASSKWSPKPPLLEGDDESATVGL